MVLFFYIHINYHLKTNDDLEIYTVDNPSKHQLDEICNLRQPVVFTYPDQTFRDCNISNIEEMYGVFDVNIRNLKKLTKKNSVSVPLKLKQAVTLFMNDKEQTYITENNENFLKESLAINQMKYTDNFLRPPLLSKCKYDYSLGSANTTTPLRYELNFKNYIYVPNGNIKLKLVPPRYKKHLFTTYDYENFEFRSPLNIWDIQEEYKNQYDKIKVLDLELKEGQFLFLPPYWWYTIKFNDLSSICYFKYQTFMNMISISPQILIHMLQKQNIKNTFVNTIKPLEDEIIHINNSIGVNEGGGDDGGITEQHLDKQNIQSIIGGVDVKAGGVNVKMGSVATSTDIRDITPEPISKPNFEQRITQHENIHREIEAEITSKIKTSDQSDNTTSIDTLPSK